MNNLSLLYEKPQLQYWTAAELDEIEASMSGGGASGTAFGFYYVWDQKPTVSETKSINVAGLVAEAVVGALAYAATKNGTVARKVGGAAAEYVASLVVDCGYEEIYYRSYDYFLRAKPNNPAKAVGYVCGQVCVTEYYEDRLRLVSISEPSLYSNISEELSYKEASCPAWKHL